jgi:hypothetical protein
MIPLEEKDLNKHWLIVEATIFVVLFSFAAQIYTFSLSASSKEFSGVVYAAGNVPVVGAGVSANGSQGSGVAVTDSSGHYSITEGLKTGTYSVEVFAIGYLIYKTDNVNVNVGQTTSGIDALLQKSGAVSGTVTDAVTHNPLGNIMIVAYNPSNGTFGFEAMTASDGTYDIATNLVTGSYNITVLFPEGHVSQSTTASVTVGVETQNVNFALAESGIIIGRITTPNGTPLKDVTVTAFSNGGSYGYATTNATGYYRMANGLGTDSYTVMAISGMNMNETSNVVVTAGQVTSGVDMWLTVSPPTPSGIITGTVTDQSNGKPIASATVSATGSGSGTAETDQNGNYVISSNLGTGTYTVSVDALGYQSQNITGVSVTVNLVTANVNFQLSKLPHEQSGTITGTVQGEANPIPELQYPIAVALIATLMAVAATRVFSRTKRFERQRTRISQ